MTKWILAFLLLSMPAAAQEVVDFPATGGSVTWTPGTPSGTVYRLMVSWDGAAESLHVVTPDTVSFFNGLDGQTVRFRVQGCYGTVAEPTDCGPFSPSSVTARLHKQVVPPGAPGAPQIMLVCSDPLKPRAGIVDNVFVCLEP